MVTANQERFFFEHYGLTNHDLETYLAAALSAGGDYADLYFEYLTSTSLMVDESLVKSASQGISAGCGVRVVSGERTGYAYTDDLSPQRILHAARTAALIASAPGQVDGRRIPAEAGPQLVPGALPSVDADITAKVELLMRADQGRARLRSAHQGSARELCRRTADHSGGRLRRHVCGRLAAAGAHECFLHREDRREFGARQWPAAAGRVALDFFFGDKTPEFFAKEAARQAILQLDAREAPAGDMEVVLGPGWPGVLLHEAVGHGLEADFNRKKTSAFAGLIGKRVASEKCTVVDNGTMPWRRGSLNVDDEGQPTQETVLIENGILKGYLSDKLSSRLMGLADTGNGRRESYEHIPMPRMTNTYMLAGQDDPGRHYSFGEKWRVCGELRRRAGRHHERQVCVLGVGSVSHRRRTDHRADQGRNADRQRARCADAGFDGRQRFETRRRRRHLRQRWTGRAGRRRHSRPLRSIG
jgi:TldD protein